MLLNNFTLLYVEDDKDTQNLIKILLGSEVKKLYMASDGLEGLQMYKDKKPDIIMTDINMPNMDGIEMAIQIKNINYYQPIILLSAYSDIEYLKKSVNTGIDKYIIKPISNQDKFFDTLESIAKILQIYKEKKDLEKVVQTQLKVAAMGELINNIAHQWRQPLSIISTAASGMSMNLEFGVLSDEMIKNYTKNIINQTIYLSQTIDDFRDFCLDTSSNKGEFNIKDTIAKVISFIQDLYKSNHIEIVVNCDDCVIKQNESQLLLAFLNMFNNTKEAFIINKIKGNRYLFIDLKEVNNIINISFMDNAGGISNNIIDKIFEPYFTTKHQFTGTGMGLYITNRIITNIFCGIIKVNNTEYKYNDINYKGAKFNIELKKF